MSCGIGSFTILRLEFNILPSFVIEGDLFFVKFDTNARCVRNKHFTANILVLIKRVIDRINANAIAA